MFAADRAVARAALSAAPFNQVHADATVANRSCKTQLEANDHSKYERFRHDKFIRRAGSDA